MKVLTALLILFAGFFLWARWQERRAVFFPARDLYRTPASEGLEYEDAYFRSGEYTLHGWWLPGVGEKVVLWMHGNAGNIADRLEQAAVMNRSLGVSSLLFDYRGYGKSEGNPSEEGLYRDADAAFRWLTDVKRIDPGAIVLYGHSLGTAVAVDLALRLRGASGPLVLESPFTSAAGLAREIYFGLPVGLVMSVRLDNMGRVGEVTVPVLVIHGERDSVIPFGMGKKVYEAAPEPKAFLPVAGGDHSDCYVVGGEGYWSAWKRLLDQAEIQNPKSKI